MENYNFNGLAKGMGIYKNYHFCFPKLFFITSF